MKMFLVTILAIRTVMCCDASIVTGPNGILVGDGSQITNIPDSALRQAPITNYVQIQANVNNNITSRLGNANAYNGTFLGDASALTNIVTPSWTNQATYLVSGAFTTVSGMGIVSVALTITNTGYAVLSNATTGYALMSRNYLGAWTNDDNLQLPVNNGDSIVFTNYGGTANVTLKSSQFAGLKMP